MKRTLVERVAGEMFSHVGTKPLRDESAWLRHLWAREARRIIAMVRRHDKRKAGKQ